jgi:hypothetical protein
MTFRVLRPFADHQVGSSLPDLVGHNVEYLLAAGFVVEDDTNNDEQPARTISKKTRKD